MTWRAIPKRVPPRRESGQTTTEYLVVISVIVVAVALLSHDIIMPAFEGGTQNFKRKMEPAAEKGVFGEPGKTR